MQSPDDQGPSPLHPIRESVGFLSSALAALARLFWPAHRRAATGEEEIVGEAEPVHLRLTEDIARLAPYPVDD